MRILVLGGDGYLGWPLSVRLARDGNEVFILDNLLRRKLVAAHGATLFDLLPLPERVAQARNHVGTRLHFLIEDILNVDLLKLLFDFKPDAIINLAQQPSAPYAMAGVNEALQTVANNELSNIKLIWSVRDYNPNVPIIKMASFGAYEKCGVDIGCGYYQPIINGQRTSKPILRPMAADDVYHITKINDINFDAMACRKWGLNITEVMQSTIFGMTASNREEPSCFQTRFDYDATFGTVLNRFMVQAVCGQPLTVYGTGQQRTGLMSLGSAVESLASIAVSRKGPGHHFINHVTISDLSVLEIAQRVHSAAASIGFKVEINIGGTNPRNEIAARKMEYRVAASTSITEAIEWTFPVVAKIISRNRESVNLEAIRPGKAWDETPPLREMASQASQQSAGQ